MNQQASKPTPDKTGATTQEAHPCEHMRDEADSLVARQNGGAEMTPFPVQLRDGTRALLRPVLPEDRGRLQAGLLLMSAESRYRRFFSPQRRLDEEQLRYSTEVDQENHVAWIALDPSSAGLPGIGIARFIQMKEQPATAEVAFAVIDAWQGRGLGSALLAILYLTAQKRGITTLRAVVLIENSAMTSWFRHLGAKGTMQTAGVTEMDLIVHPDLSRLPQNLTGRRFAHCVRELQNQIQLAKEA